MQVATGGERSPPKFWGCLRKCRPGAEKLTYSTRATDARNLLQEGVCVSVKNTGGLPPLVLNLFVSEF